MCLHPNKRYLAVCEKAKQAMCIIYELSSIHIKRKRILTSSECKATEFVHCSFANSDEKVSQYLVTVVSVYPLLIVCRVGRPTTGSSYGFGISSVL